jgi:hypothetical protein
MNVRDGSIDLGTLGRGHHGGPNPGHRQARKHPQPAPKAWRRTEEAELGMNVPGRGHGNTPAKPSPDPRLSWTYNAASARFVRGAVNANLRRRTASRRRGGGCARGARVTARRSPRYLRPERFQIR